MDRSWITKSRITTEYQNGLQYFLDYAFRNTSMNDKILCPCKRCGMGICVSRDDAFEHLTVDGFIPGYTQWIAHGELPSILSARGENQRNTLGDDDVQGSVHDAFGVPNEDRYTEEYAGQIKGKDKPEHLRMMGQGVCPSDILNGTPKSTSNRLIMEYKEKIARLEARLETQQKICASQVHKGTDGRVSESLSLNATSTQVDQVMQIARMIEEAHKTIYVPTNMLCSFG
ncbi:hypothetical protein SASPL_143686 [Salvia splendens]|uniref:Transposase-associated domain-containing protein n=1 Tax=Salvia splendens TaxID=180675 RepID=A0A8X8ZAK6_SALSN|nr:hypothetical protein SASPL_143686 [Salvia splendens]